MDHHRGGGIVEGAGVDQIDLAASTLLGGRSQHGDPDSEVVYEAAQRHAGPQGGRCDDVVPTGMANLGQRVIFAADHDPGPR